jgi:hypothetical protein
MTVHIPVVTLTTATRAALDLADVTLVGASITHGAADLWTVPDPSTATFTVLDPDGSLRGQVDFGTTVTMTTAGEIRFTGEVTDMRTEWGDEGWQLALICVGSKVRTSGFLVAPRPAETAADRIAAVWAMTGVTVHAVDGYRSVTLKATTDNIEAGTLTADAAIADLGLIQQRRDGAMWYRGRSTVAATATIRAVLPASGVFLDSTWVRAIGDTATRVRCGFGDNNPPTVAEVINGELEGRLGRAITRNHSDAYNGMLDADLIATEALDRLTDPVWRTDGLNIDLALPAYSDARTGDVLSLDIGDLVLVSGAPGGSPPSTNPAYLILGWDETLDGDGHRLNLNVVEFAVVQEVARWGNTSAPWESIGTAIQDYVYAPPNTPPGVTP